MQNLSDKLLIASPYTMGHSIFHQSLIYVMKHAANGSAGLIINRMVEKMDAQKLFQSFSIGAIAKLNIDIHMGGPADMDRGFFLHSDDYKEKPLFTESKHKIIISSNSDILEAIAYGRGPAHNLFIVGYTAWQAGQLEDEMASNLWLVTDPSKDILFNVHAEQKWQRALNTLGISSGDFIPPSDLTC